VGATRTRYYRMISFGFQARYRRTMRRFLILTLLCLAGSGIHRDATAQTWTTHGPEGAKIQVLAVDPHDSATVYAGTWSAGVFKSTDSGATWSAANDGVTSRLVFDLAIDPQTPTTVYLAVDGVYKSTDAARTWRAINNGLPGSSPRVRALAVDPQSSATVYATLSSSQGFVYKSIDGGETWAATGAALNDGNVTALVVDPQSSATLYAAGLSRGVLRSDDGGTTWRAMTVGLTDLAVEALVIDRATPTTLYVGTRRGGVFKSSDGGNSWSAPTAVVTGKTSARACRRSPRPPSRYIHKRRIACSSEPARASPCGTRRNHHRHSLRSASHAKGSVAAVSPPTRPVSTAETIVRRPTSKAPP
jgi:photosystem II stability/assembly factor-like uncharacterized protein